jgi:hypothetical protein
LTVSHVNYKLCTYQRKLTWGAPNALLASTTDIDAAATNPLRLAFESTSDFSGVVSGVLDTRLRRLDGVSKSSTGEDRPEVSDIRLTMDVTALPTVVDNAVAAAVVTTDSTVSNTDDRDCSIAVGCSRKGSEKSH